MASCKISKSLALRYTAFAFAALAFNSLFFISLVGSRPAQATDQKGAKGLFFEQLEKPSQSLNTGLRYWIEMERNGTSQRVSNKTQFKSGDSIRFHIRPNITGYAYILLSSGSRGEQSVLFPDEKMGENNKVDGGREYILPQDGALTFDENPGTEKLTLLLSRSPINATAYLAKPAREKEVTLIASAQTGSKDLVPARIVIAYNAPHSDAPPPMLIASANKPPLDKVEKINKIDKAEKTEKVAKVTKKVTIASTSSATFGKHSIVRRTNLVASSNLPNAKDDEGTTTVVSEKSTGVLHVDVDLQHI